MKLKGKIVDFGKLTQYEDKVYEMVVTLDSKFHEKPVACNIYGHLGFFVTTFKGVDFGDQITISFKKKVVKHQYNEDGEAVLFLDGVTLKKVKGVKLKDI